MNNKYFYKYGARAFLPVIITSLATTAAYGDDGEGALATGACGGMVKNRLPDAEVQFTLSWDWERREFAPNTSNMSEGRSRDHAQGGLGVQHYLAISFFKELQIVLRLAVLINLFVETALY